MMRVLNEGILVRKLTWTGLSHTSHRPQFARQAVICGKRIRSGDEVTEDVKYTVQIGTRKATYATVSLWRKVI